ncbi:L,D-transpeptidase family protein [Afifella sp. JA880]|uniref:L,D-transpeptidase family protein n=1 Tax=Afifella sp. JA880 TaxID=2975280 RepID=UPI0021BAD2BE|nr:L,D-transpeptidase family protein [Afifella sp. JA880]MCT8268055.1 L,D-transpeptidase family protein [Afifella sp. JA880]
MRLRGTAVFLALMAATPVAAAPALKVATVGVEDAAETSSPAITTEAAAIRAALAHQPGYSDPRAKDIAASVRSFYEERSFAPVWIHDGKATEQARALLDRMARAAEDGLAPSDFEAIELPQDQLSDADAIAAKDVALSENAARFITHLAIGRVLPKSVNKEVYYAPALPDLGEALAKTTMAKDVDATISAFAPPHPQYQALKAKLAKLRESDGKPLPHIAEGPTLKVGQRDPRVLTLRERLGIEIPEPPQKAQFAPVPAADMPEPETTGSLAQTASSTKMDEASRSQPPAGFLEKAHDYSADLKLDPTPVAYRAGNDAMLYDETVVAAVEDFQRENGLSVDGMVGPQTLETLNGASRENRIKTVIVNMERWRWMPRDFSDDYIFVNVPEFMVRVYRDGALNHETRVVVGQRSHPTPLFGDEMDHLILNPYWNVPNSIVTAEMLPKIRKDPYGYFNSTGYQLLADIRGKTYRLDPTRIDWYAVDTRQLRIRQPPGDRNALGRIKFMFPNRHAVYLHDTPAKSLFQRSSRAFSHGCVRVQDPMAFADSILANDDQWNSTRLKRMYSNQEVRINLQQKLPVFLAYFTMIPEADGSLKTVPDVYGYDEKLAKLLNL